ncbi:unnamed protein product [Bursaphelenchus okinawaensis]|uniref:Cytochrome P450 n=1 Tax=Bursaphelenchus okinawaensis TaxID=465554 RepID=A0A811K709_9BILA|nr:unnamed protein product [Bursaphelenchus okinawaensis]CAG9092728.1 unnamed protein product [Bursaphelenchus okinawaensis]
MYSYSERRNVTSSRYGFYEFNDYCRCGNGGIIFSPDPKWKERRKFSNKVLRAFGMGKNLMEQKILEVVVPLIEEYKQNSTQSDITVSVKKAIGSIINSFLFGYTFIKEHAAKYDQLDALVRTHIEGLGDPLILLSVDKPKFMAKIPNVGQKVEAVRQSAQNLKAFFHSQIVQHRQEVSFETDQESQDYTQEYFKEQRRRAESGDDETFSDESLYQLCYDLWLAGQDTTSNTISRGIAFIVNNPQIQEKIHNELDTVIDSNRVITLKDRPNLPYLCATLNEAQRISNLVSQNTWRHADEDFTVNGVTVKKGTCFIPQISAVLFDENIYKDPKTFNPDRFIDQNGQLKVDENFMPFCIGRRACLGEGLAKMELFLFMANVLNTFKLTSTTGRPVDVRRKTGVIVQTIPFGVQFTTRR